ncbi:hypothetical protein BFG60_2225 [Microcystis aeruginosa NIES-98]|nr:hypothetical protein BFG60_2225 [Microcystis aeruginosa NIES-98]
MAKTLVLFFFGVGLDATWQFLPLRPSLLPTPQRENFHFSRSPPVI